MRVAYKLHDGVGHDMVDGTCRRQPIHHRVSTVNGVAVVHPIEGEDTVGCRVSPSNPIQHPADRQEPCRSHHGEQWYVVRGTTLPHGATVISEILQCLRQSISCYNVGVFAVMYTYVLDNSSDKSDEGSSSYAVGDAESAQPAGQQYDVCSRDCRHRVYHLQSAASYLESDEAPRVYVSRGLVLCGHSVLYASRKQLGRKCHNLHHNKQTVPKRLVCKRLQATFSDTGGHL